jgi:predicted membrane channel-forming protein YqfA (hemolysin III family)
VSDDDESRLDRELIELLNELRVALPGVQILFAFLLTVPFNNRFERVTDLQRDVYFVAFLLTLASTTLLMAPTAYHRLRWRQHDKEKLLRVSNRLAIAGIALLALAMTASIFFVTDFLFESYAAALVSAGAAVMIALFWFVLPLRPEARAVASAKDE